QPKHGPLRRIPCKPALSDPAAPMLVRGRWETKVLLSLPARIPEDCIPRIPVHCKLVGGAGGPGSKSSSRFLCVSATGRVDHASWYGLYTGGRRGRCRAIRTGPTPTSPPTTRYSAAPPDVEPD